MELYWAKEWYVESYLVQAAMVTQLKAEELLEFCFSLSASGMSVAALAPRPSPLE